MNLKYLKKQTYLKVLIALLACTLFIPIIPAQAATVNGFIYLPGDILITKSGFANGLIGHAGIVHPDGKNVIHIEGFGKKPRIISISTWLSRYRSTKVVRHTFKTPTVKAANWARDYYINGAGKNTPYDISRNPKDRRTVYCSELVWQAYYYGANLTFKVPYISSQSITNYYTPNIITPYHFIDINAQRYNDFKTVKSINW